MEQKRIVGLVVEVPGADLKELFAKLVTSYRTAAGAAEERVAEQSKKRAALDEAGVGKHTQDHVLGDHRYPGRYGLLDQEPEALLETMKGTADIFEKYASYIDEHAVYVMTPADYSNIGRMSPVNLARGIDAALGCSPAVLC